MRLLALDIGSSSVKAAVLTNGRTPRGIVRYAFPTIYSDQHGVPRAEVKVAVIERAIRDAIEALGAAARRVDLIAATTMSPSWLAMDARGRPLANIITHQDRRSVAEAAEIEQRVGRQRHLDLVGNRPFPGGISSTTWAWHLRHERALMKKASLVGHLGTWLVLALTGERVIDLSNAGFTGLMSCGTDISVCDDGTQAGMPVPQWCSEIIDAVGADRALLPRIVESDATIGSITAAAARRFGLVAGTPLLAGCIDGSAAMLSAGAKVGQVVNVAGSTDVLAVCTDRPRPHEELLTRPLGVDGKWLSVGTIAAAGSAIEWMHANFFADFAARDFFRRVNRFAMQANQTRVIFDAALAGSRTAMNLPAASITGLTLSTNRDDILRALLSDLAGSARRRFDRFRDAGVTLGKDVLLTGGGARLAKQLFRTGWAAGTRTRSMEEATLRGLWQLASKAERF